MQNGPGDDFDKLLAESSLGSPQAMAIRAQTPPEASARFLRQMVAAQVAAARLRYLLRMDWEELTDEGRAEHIASATMWLEAIQLAGFAVVRVDSGKRKTEGGAG